MYLRPPRRLRRQPVVDSLQRQQLEHRHQAAQPLQRPGTGHRCLTRQNGTQNQNQLLCVHRDTPLEVYAEQRQITDEMVAVARFLDL